MYYFSTNRSKAAILNPFFIASQLLSIQSINHCTGCVKILMGRRVFLLRVLIVSQTVQYTTQYVLVDIFCLQASIRAFKSTSLSPGSSPSSLSRSVSVIFLLHRFQNYENFNWFCVSFTPMCCCELMIIYSSYSAMTSSYANANSSRCIFPVSMAYIPPRCRFPVSMAYFSQVYVPCVMTVSVSWMSFWLDHKAVRKGCLDLILITSTLVPENVSGCPILSKTSYCAGARQSCPRGHHSAGNVHNSGFDILQKENAFHLTYQQLHTQVIKHILQKKLIFIPGISDHNPYSPTRPASKTHCPRWPIRKPSTCGPGCVSSLSSALFWSMLLSTTLPGGQI